MSRKYTFYYRSFALQLVNEAGLNNEVLELESPQKAAKDLVAQLGSAEPVKTVFYTSNLDESLAFVESLCPCVMAGGGLVNDNQNEWLLIHRRGSWDLPKGKVDDGESIEQAAVREVEEECGVVATISQNEPFVTRHFYYGEGRWCIKKSYWFLMVAEGHQVPKPQYSEDIEEALWAPIKTVQSLLPEAYLSVRAVFQHFLGL